ncbi:MAG: hypothetical protein SPJ78_02380 [Corynebacterium camporealensis]|uniref:hypothetical protein n=1 Tax=Corynebacterium camporealensis TaxID=161896 RepID=UPI002A90F5CC|nr:hypothetical protein [Corynebacterium camporealensis]MDY5839561.1 hypothetical protein [Corynebacterium camporealensis]
MKKFPRFATASLVFAAGLTLAACHPPNQQDSNAEKVDNASTFTGTAPAVAENAESQDTGAATNEAGEPQILEVTPTEAIDPEVRATDGIADAPGQQ